MGEYANPTGYVDTQTGQHFRDLATNITNIVGKASSDYIAQMKANAEERKKLEKEAAQEKREADAISLKYQSDAAAVSNKNTKIDFSKTFDSNLTKVGTLGLLEAKGSLTHDEKTELNVLRLSPGGVEAYIGTWASVGEGFVEDYNKDFGTAGSIDRFFNSPEIIEPLKASTGLNPKVKKTGFNNIYDPKTQKMQNSMYWEIEGQDTPLVLGDQIMEDIQARGKNVILRVPNTQDEGIAYNASQALIWEKTKAGKDGKLMPTGVLNDSFKFISNKEEEYKGRKVVNGIAYQDTDIVTTNGKVTNSTRTYFQRNDMNKLFTPEWEFKQKELFAESTADHELSVKSLYFNVFEPKLAAMAADKDTTPEDKEKIKNIQKEFGLINKDNKPNRKAVTPEQKDRALEAHIMIQKDLLTKQYEFTPILNDDGSVKTTVEKKVAVKAGKTKAGNSSATSANTAEMVTNALNETHVGQITTNIGNRNRPSLVTKNARGLYDVTDLDGDPIQSNMTYDQMKLALETASAPAAKKIKK